jgi:hypothetical protein
LYEEFRADAPPELNLTSARKSLGLGPAVASYRMGHDEVIVVREDGVPGQTQSFSAAQAREEVKCDQRLFLAFGCLDYPFNLVGRKRLNLAIRTRPIHRLTRLRP